jgi:uncharacterized damage-inducible protein DinB
MNPILRDLLEHQCWADVEHLNAIGAHQLARGDAAIAARLHHLHLVQRAFAWAVGPRAVPFTSSKAEGFPTLGALEEFARGSHDALREAVSAMSPARLDERVDVPWFQNPPLSLTVAEALTQCAMHSHYHRGQNATRLRELGGVPPLTDLIVWYWRGKPAPAWSANASR